MKLRVKREKKSRGTKDAEKLLRVRREKKSRGNKDAEPLLKVRREKLGEQGCRAVA